MAKSASQVSTSAAKKTITSEMVTLAVKDANAIVARQIQEILEGPPDAIIKRIRALKNKLLD